MNIITVSKDNIEEEHICCAISNNKDCQVASKKSWMLERFQDGLVFKKGDYRGKCFIEYIPAEKAWVPIEAKGYMYINCFWVSGQLKGKGYSNQLLEECIKDSMDKGKLGLVILSAQKKMPFLADPEYLKYKGFQMADTAKPYYELMYFPFCEDSCKPRFKQSVRESNVNSSGFVLYYTHQCPFTAKYVPLIEEAAKAKGVDFQTVHINTRMEAQNAPAPFTSYSLFYEGAFLTNEVLSVKKFEKMLSTLSQS